MLKSMQSCAVALVPALTFRSSAFAPAVLPAGLVFHFNGTDLTRWKISEGDFGRWIAIGGVMDYRGRSEVVERKKDLRIANDPDDSGFKPDWRIKSGFGHQALSDVLSDVTYRLVAVGKPMLAPRLSAHSDIYLRGTPKAQVNIWCSPIGSNEIYGHGLTQPKRKGTSGWLPSKRRRSIASANGNVCNHVARRPRHDFAYHKDDDKKRTIPRFTRRKSIGFQYHSMFKNGKSGGAAAKEQFPSRSIKGLVPAAN